MNEFKRCMRVFSHSPFKVRLISEALINSLTMGLVATFIALLLLLLWLEWGPQRRQLWLWLPILLPALPLVAGSGADIDADAFRHNWQGQAHVEMTDTRMEGMNFQQMIHVSA